MNCFAGYCIPFTHRYRLCATRLTTVDRGTKMARPRVFVSSTFYDLKHIRSSLDLFIESMGFESILFEKGDVAYDHHESLASSCYREVQGSDIFVLIVGHNYGSRDPGSAVVQKKSEMGEEKDKQNVLDEYASITRREFELAVDAEIPVYILIESAVYSEYRTYLKNKHVSGVVYAHVDSPQVFVFIEKIMELQRNNPVHAFERFSDIENWLREQWAGLFREMLQSKSRQKVIANLSSEVADLREVAGTVKTYLEALMKKRSPREVERIIENEEQRISSERRFRELSRNPLIRYLKRKAHLDMEALSSFLERAKSFEDFVNMVSVADSKFNSGNLLESWKSNRAVHRDYNDARAVLGLDEIPRGEIAGDTSVEDSLGDEA